MLGTKDPAQKDPRSKYPPLESHPGFRDVRRQNFFILLGVTCFVCANVGWVLRQGPPVVTYALIMTLGLYAVFFFMFSIFLWMVWPQGTAINVMLFMATMLGAVVGQCLSYNVNMLLSKYQ